MYKDHALSYWVLLHGSGIVTPPGSKDLTDHVEAVKAIRSIGTNAIPYLLQWVQYERPAPIKVLEGAIEKVFPSPAARNPFYRRKESKKEIRASAVFNAFLVLKETGAPAIPELARLGGDTRRPEVADRARRCMWALLLEAAKASDSPESCGLLVNSLRDTNAVTRAVAADVIEVVRASVVFTPPPPIWEERHALTNAPPQ
jgi:hypothetical protein